MKEKRRRMKRKQFGTWGWSSILSSSYQQKDFHNDDFQGTIGYVSIDKTTEYTSWVVNGEEIQVGQAGMKWLQIWRQDADYVITAMFSQEGEVNLFYVDMVDHVWKDEESGVLTYEDLFLDLLIESNGKMHVEDRIELEEAFQAGRVSKEQYEKALQTCHRLQFQLVKDFDAFVFFAKKYLAEFSEGEE